MALKALVVGVFLAATIATRSPAKRSEAEPSVAQRSKGQ